MRKILDTTKGFDEEISAQRERTQQEKAEVDTIYSALGKEFPQKAELDLVRENHAAVIRELQRMQEDDGYVSEWQPKKISENCAPSSSPKIPLIIETINNNIDNEKEKVPCLSDELSKFNQRIQVC